MESINYKVLAIIIENIEAMVTESRVLDTSAEHTQNEWADDRSTGGGRQ